MRQEHCQVDQSGALFISIFQFYAIYVRTVSVGVVGIQTDRQEFEQLTNRNLVNGGVRLAVEVTLNGNGVNELYIPLLPVSVVIELFCLTAGDGRDQCNSQNKG